jgi:PHAX RNA-binding domain
MDTLTTAQLAATLQEPHIPLLHRVLERLGQERCATLLAETLALEAQGGLRILHRKKHKRRRRTPGGVFLFLVKKFSTKQERAWIFARDATK